MKALSKYIQESQTNEGLITAVASTGISVLLLALVNSGIMLGTGVISRLIHLMRDNKMTDKFIKEIDKFVDKYPELKDKDGAFMGLAMLLYSRFDEFSYDQLKQTKEKMDKEVAKCGRQAVKDWEDLKERSKDVWKYMGIK